MNTDQSHCYEIALMLIPGIGCRSARQLLDIYPSAEDVYHLSLSELRTVFGSHRSIIDAIRNKTTMARAEEEVAYAQKNHIDILFYKDPRYPQRLNRAGCEDCPIVLYSIGNADLNAKHIVSIVGTRRATEYGRTVVHDLVSQMQGEDILVVSGLAYGIDTCAHSEALNAALPTVGVLGHGLDHIYPSQNRQLAKKMVSRGGLLTEYISYTPMNPSYFPARNRIIAALSDATIVVEASAKGGALITANMANGYHRDVFAVPGPLKAIYSVGCNNLIADNKASLLRNVDDLFYILNWQRNHAASPGVQNELFSDVSALTKDEQTVVGILKEHGPLAIDEMTSKTELSLPKIATALLSLELSGHCKCLPGKIYKLI
ncbi:MAG: DNA-processing protein DprA [Bacteroidales bacterium]|nr:DNA-processing protein DprA [Bacteroidales bacterium]